MNFDIFAAMFQMSAPSILMNYRTNCLQNFISNQKFHKIISLKGHKDLHEPYSKSCTPNIQDLRSMEVQLRLMQLMHFPFWITHQPSVEYNPKREFN